MPVYNIAYVKAHFAQIIRSAIEGEEVVIAKDNRPLLKLVALASSNKRKPGSAKGKIRFIADDFDAPLSEFADYMPPSPPIPRRAGGNR